MHWRFLLAGTVMAFLGVPACHAQASDYWLKIERNGAGFSWEHIRSVDLPGEEREYRIEKLTKMDVAGRNPQEIREEGVFRVSRDLRPLSFHFQSRSQVKQTQVSGKCVGGRMHVSVSGGEGEKLNPELNCRYLIFLATLPDWLARHHHQKSFRRVIFDPPAIQPVPTDVRITRAKAGQINADLGDTVYQIDPDGRLREVDDKTMHTRAFRTDSQDAQNITTLNTADGFTLTVHAEGDLPNPFRLKKAVISVRWHDVPLKEFRLEDKRQKIVGTLSPKKGAEGAYEALIEFTHFDPSGVTGVEPVPAGVFSGYLGDDEYIKPGDPAVRAQLAEIRGQETEPRAIIERILKWIWLNIGPELTLQTLPAPEVLRRRSGKCTENAVLFASLARAAGIPVKIVLGDVTDGGDWVGHMWNEVWLGEWLPVDPSMGSWVVDPSHLKLVEAPDVNGTQSLRWKLVDNLALTIRSFEEDDRGAPVGPTGMAENTYTNGAYRCRVSRPDANWEVTEDSDGSIVRVTFEPPVVKDAKWELSMFPVPPGSPASTILDRRIKALAGIIGPLDILESTQSTIAKREAACTTFRSRLPKQGQSSTALLHQNCILVEDVDGYLLQSVSPEEKKEELQPAFHAIFASFKLLP
jgi:hypothetical protein